MHVMVADVKKSSDTVDESILDTALGQLGLLDWFRRTYVAYHSQVRQVRLRFKIAAGLGEPWCMDWFTPGLSFKHDTHRCIKNVPWCRHFDSLPDGNPQLYADNLKCSAERSGALFDSARFTAQYVRAVGQDVSPGKCFLLSTSKSVRKALKLRDISGMAAFGRYSWMSGILVVILISLGGLGLGGQGWCCCCGCFAFWTSGQAWGWFVVSIFLPVFMQLRLPTSPPRRLVPLGLLLFGQCASKMPLAGAPAILNLLDVPVGIDPAFHIFWARFRMMRWYLACCPDEEPHIFRMRDLISRGAQGRGPVHLLLNSAAELGFAWDGDEKGWIGVSLPHL